MKITGLDALTRELDQAQKALSALDGELATVRFDPNDKRSIEAAIAKIERTIDRKFAPYSRNSIVIKFVHGMKTKYREALLKRAAEAA